VSPVTVVADTSPVIALAQIGQLSLLRALFSNVFVPPAVRAEIRSVTQPDWIEERPLADAVDPRVLVATLHAGEREAIALALEVGASHILLDDLAARALAERLGLSVLGTLGILLLAKQRGLVPAVRPHLNSLRSVDFFATEALYRRVCTLAGEEY
jgi:predicted nucleic acid-binding protein